jgi:hypothetical protein
MRTKAATPAIERRQELIKCSFWCPRELWRETKIRAMDESLELQQLMVKALQEYLSVSPGPTRIGGRR